MSFGQFLANYSPILHFNTIFRFEIMASNNKNLKLYKKIGTHNGMFHCDEALACFMLKLLPEYAEAEIVRTRDMKVRSRIVFLPINKYLHA